MTTPSAPSTGTIDITNVVESVRTSWVTYMVAVLMGAEASIPQLAWMVTTPIIDTIDKDALTLAMNVVSKEAVMMAFFVNTAIKKASQAADLVNAVQAKESLPDTASPEEFASAEKNQILAFSNFVVLDN